LSFFFGVLEGDLLADLLVDRRLVCPFLAGDLERDLDLDFDFDFERDLDLDRERDFVGDRERERDEDALRYRLLAGALAFVLEADLERDGERDAVGALDGDLLADLRPLALAPRDDTEDDDE